MAKMTGKEMASVLLEALKNANGGPPDLWEFRFNYYGNAGNWLDVIKHFSCRNWDDVMSQVAIMLEWDDGHSENFYEVRGVYRRESDPLSKKDFPND